MRRRALRQREAGIRAREADSLAARRVDRRDETGVHAAGQHADDDVERVGIGDAQAVHLVFRNAGARKRPVDLLAAAAHHGQRQQRGDACDDSRKAAQSHLVFEQFAADLQHPPAARHHTNPRSLVEAVRDVEVLHGLSRRP